ncbi:MAG: HAMP domain-containing sensor histidine kinase, partial [Pseudomonadota bacterium]
MLKRMIKGFKASAPQGRCDPAEASGRGAVWRDPVWRGAGDAAVLELAADGAVLAASENAPRLFGEPSGLDGLTLQGLCDGASRDGILNAIGARDACVVDAATLAHPETRLRLQFAPAAAGGVCVLALPASAEEANASDAPMDEAVELLADLSHEMKTPLNAVIGFADAMRRETFGPLGGEKYVEYADHIAASGAHLVDLITTILDLAKSQSGRLPIKRAVVRLDDIAAECLAMVSGPAEDAGLTATATIAPDLPDAFLDGRAVRQILINLHRVRQKID